MSWRRRVSRSYQKGFTIVELLIATLVFSLVLLVITIGIMHFTNDYYKGVNNSATQDTARNIIDTVSQAIEFGGGYFNSVQAGGQTTTYCIGNLQFDFILGKQLNASPSAGQTKDALYQSPIQLSDSCQARSIGGGISISGGKELIAPNMRLSDFEIDPLGNDLYNIQVRVVYGDSDLLTNPTGKDANCKLQTGSQFCAVAALSTTVQSRVMNAGQ